MEIAGEADAAAEGDGPIDAAGDATGFMAAGDADGDGDGAGLAAGEAAGATVGAAAGGLVGVDGAAEVQLAKSSTEPVSTANRHEDDTKTDTPAFYGATR